MHGRVDADACSLLASFAASFPLRRPSPIATMEMAGYLLTRSEGTIGELKIEYARLLKDQGSSYGEISTKTGILKTSLHRYLQG